jgi:CRISP-associated protein Cas1
LQSQTLEAAELQERVHDPNVGKLVERWIKSGVLTDSGLVLPEKGIPQGAVISPILANVYLDDFDEAMADAKLKLVRFADDFVVLAKTQKRIEAAQELVDELLTAMGLELHPDKTRITNFDRGFHFLGHTFVRSLVEDQHQSKQYQRSESQQAKPAQDKVPILRYADPPQQNSLMQQAFLEAIQASEKPVAPPLYVVMGFKVRDEKPIEIQSYDLEWKAGMSTVYLVQQGATFRKEQGRFVLQPPGNSAKPEETEIPIREVERVLVFGNVQLSTQAMSECLAEQIPVFFLSQQGEYKGHLWSAEQTDIKVQAAQFRLWDDVSFQVRMTQRLVKGKLWNSKQLLLRLRRQRDLPEVTTAIAGLEQAWQAVDTATDTVGLDVLRGYEGVAATRYFAAFGNLITNTAFSFKGRNRRPPTDPVNSLLSFGYTLLFNNVLSLILVEGLNPYLGNLHRSERNEPHLAFDLMEEFRSPIVDSLVIKLVNQKVVRPTDFTYPNKEGGVYLEAQARRVFLRHFEERISSPVSHPDVGNQVSYRRVIQLQIQRYKRTVLNNVAYEPFRRAM